MGELKRWRVRVNPVPKSPSKNEYWQIGEVFEATEEEIKPYLHMVEPVEEDEKPLRRRGRPPKTVTALDEPLADRSM